MQCTYCSTQCRDGYIVIVSIMSMYATYGVYGPTVVGGWWQGGVTGRWTNGRVDFDGYCYEQPRDTNLDRLLCVHYVRVVNSYSYNSSYTYTSRVLFSYSARNAVLNRSPG